MYRRWALIILILAFLLTGCGQANQAEQPTSTPRPLPTVPTMEIPTIPTPSPDPNLQSNPIPQQGTD